MAGIGVRGERLLPAVSEALELPAQGQTAAQFGRNGCHGENMVGADRHALFLAFAAIPVDDGPRQTRCLFAVRVLDIHYSNFFEWFSEDPFR